MRTIHNPARIERLLRQLYLKKKWLDTMIDGLEAAVQSPGHHFIESVGRTLGNGRQHKPKVDLRRQQQARLARLASQVRRNGSARSWPREVAGAAKRSV